MESTATKSALSDRFWFGATALLILGIALRQWSLGNGPFHPDEAIHAFFSSGFKDYRYDPVYHGPVLYHLVSTVFGIFGQHDYTARLIPSLLGILLLVMVLGPMRQFLGNRGALVGAALLAVSPSIVTYSRHLLHDSLVLVLTLGAVGCFLVSLQSGADTARGREARIGLVALLTLFLATKANFFFILVMLSSFYVAWLASGTIKISNLHTRWIPVVLFAIVSASAILYPRDNTFGDPEKEFQHKAFQGIALLACGSMGLWLLTGAPRKAEEATPKSIEASEEGEGEPPTKPEKVDRWTTYVLMLATILWLYVFLFGNGAQILMEWAQTRQFPSETFSEGSQSARSAISKMLGYWGGQQAKPRLPGRHDYYFVLMLLYEVPIFLAALGGIWHAAKNRSTFSDLLLWWAFTSWTVYAVANEKVPWLLVHTVLPLALLGGLWLGQVRWKGPIFAVAALAGLLFSLRGVSGSNFERAGDNVEPILYAQTPDAFRDAMRGALQKTQGDQRNVWLSNDKQWPSVWYLGNHQPYVGKSVMALPPMENADNYRAAISSEEDWPQFKTAGWKGQRVNFLIWPRASWFALAPQRYARWFWTREAIPRSERDLAHGEWKTSILGGKGEWSHAVAIVGRPGK